MQLLRFLILPTLFIPLVSSNPAPAKTTPTVQCKVVFAPDLRLSYRPEQAARITLGQNRKQTKTQLGDFQIQGIYNEERTEGTLVQLIVTPTGTNLPIASNVYKFPYQRWPQNQFLDNHGFTGSNFVMNPKSNSTLTYSCTMIR